MIFKNNTAQSSPKLSEDAASKLLANVFDACQQEPNTIPLPKLASYSEYRRERYGVQKFLLIAVLVIFLLLPLCFIAPEFTVERKADTDDSQFPTYEIKVETDFPVSQVAASIDGEGLVVSETADHVYTVMPTHNGVLRVIVRLINRQYNVYEVAITGIDADAPLLISDVLIDNKLHFSVEDTGTGVDYDSIYAITANGEELKPEIAADGEIVFDLPDGDSNIYIPDKKGNVLHLVVSIVPTQSEGSAEESGSSN